VIVSVVVVVVVVVVIRVYSLKKNEGVTINE